jgi:2-polyprenyl-3-methyl-5-hydroxy-6-metoxy-1,4-benzoquinol methylase
MNIQLETIPCPLCKSHINKNVYSDNRIVGASGEIKINVQQCSDCNFIFNSPRPTQEGLESYYKNSDLASGQVYRDESDKGHYSILHAERANFLKESLSNDRQFSLIDIGCGNGGFLKAVRNEVPNSIIKGLDPSKQAVENCKEIEIDVIQAGINDISKMNIEVDVISLISVLEHLPDPREAIREIKKALGSTGIFYIEIPNTLKPEVSLTGFFGFEHIVHFTPATIYKLLKEEGFNKIKRDFSVDHVVRVVASASNHDLFIGDSISIEDDLEESRLSILNYCKDEKLLVHRLRNRVKSFLEDWKSSGKKVAVYGAGHHSVELSSHIDLYNFVDCYLDGDVHKQGKSFLGKEVYSPLVIKDLDIDAVIISSGRFVDEMKRTVINSGKNNLIVKTCYE